jgi:hypothetical protein
MERKRKPQILPQFTFINDPDIIERFELDDIKGQGSIVLSVLQHTPMPTDSRVVGDAVGSHPEFKTKQTFQTAGFEPKYRVTNYWLSYFRKIGLLRYTDEREELNSQQRRSGNVSNYSPFGTRKSLNPDGRKRR